MHLQNPHGSGSSGVAITTSPAAVDIQKRGALQGPVLAELLAVALLAEGLLDDAPPKPPLDDAPPAPPKPPPLLTANAPPTPPPPPAPLASSHTHASPTHMPNSPVVETHWKMQAIGLHIAMPVPALLVTPALTAVLVAVVAALVVVVVAAALVTPTVALTVTPPMPPTPGPCAVADAPPKPPAPPSPVAVASVGAAQLQIAEQGTITASAQTTYRFMKSLQPRAGDREIVANRRWKRRERNAPRAK
jgi:hypothetical protein